MLQWGRDLSAAEGGHNAGVMAYGLGSFNGAATFRPRKGAARVHSRVESSGLQWGRDLSAAEGPSRIVGIGGAGQASMGPRPFGRGRYWTERQWGNAMMLQWGRDLSAAEG